MVKVRNFVGGAQVNEPQAQILQTLKAITPILTTIFIASF